MGILDGLDLLGLEAHAAELTLDGGSDLEGDALLLRFFHDFVGRHLVVSHPQEVLHRQQFGLLVVVGLALGRGRLALAALSCERPAAGFPPASRPSGRSKGQHRKQRNPAVFVQKRMIGLRRQGSRDETPVPEYTRGAGNAKRHSRAEGGRRKGKAASRRPEPDTAEGRNETKDEDKG